MAAPMKPRRIVAGIEAPVQRQHGRLPGPAGLDHVVFRRARRPDLREVAHVLLRRYPAAQRRGAGADGVAGVLPQRGRRRGTGCNGRCRALAPRAGEPMCDGQAARPQGGSMFKRLTVLWSVVRGDARQLWFALRHPAAPGWLKVGTALIALYLLSPVDIVPDWLPVIGVIDDLVLVPLAIRWLLRRLPPEIAEAAARRR